MPTINLLQGESRKLIFTLKDDQDQTIDPASLNNVKIFLIDEGKRKTLSKFSYDSEEGYGDIAYETSTAVIYLDPLETINYPPGKVMVQISMYFPDVDYPNSEAVVKKYGELLNVLSAK